MIAASAAVYYKKVYKFFITAIPIAPIKFFVQVIYIQVNSEIRTII